MYGLSESWVLFWIGFIVIGSWCWFLFGLGNFLKKESCYPHLLELNLKGEG
jgi:hypothetical protein